MPSISRIKQLCSNAVTVLDEDGIYAFIDRVKVRTSRFHVSARKADAEAVDPLDVFTDVLFVNGCAYSVPHPIRYRVDHQIEQLVAHGVSARKVEAWDVNDDWARTAHVFVIFRCPYSEEIGRFITLAKSLGKTVLYDIDDLVIDTKYTDLIPFLSTFTEEQKRGYDDGVRAMQKAMLMCDGVITTTEGMANELKNYLPKVCINRNVASEEMLNFCNKAVRERDVFPNVSVDAVTKRERRAWKKAHEPRDGRLRIGYFSGSITHNDDFELVLPALARVMQERPEVTLCIVGELTIPDALSGMADRVEAFPFCDWRRLPKLISKVDINIAPLADSVFNRAKSENKWVEASLVKVPTVASNVGAFASEIVDGETGILCSTTEQWHDALINLIDDATRRRALAEKAYEECSAHRTTLNAGLSLVNFINDVIPSNIAFAVPSLNISGGNIVTLRHAAILQRRGIDVTIIDGMGEDRWVEVQGCRIPVINRRVLPAAIDGCPIDGTFQRLVATFWETAQFVERYRKADRRLYFVQSYEPGFYHPLDWHRVAASATYSSGLEVFTMSPWCQKWLKRDYNVSARCVKNGMDVERYSVKERDYSGKVRILIEGDCKVDYKNVDEAFRIVDKLDPKKYEVWYLSYNGEPKSFYRVDRFLHAIPSEEVHSVYEDCHILLKTSLLESFSYPPLEMMATGGIAVAISNPGNAEYLVNGENCLLINHGEEGKAAAVIESLVEDEALRDRLISGGIKTAQSRDWSRFEDEIASVYLGE